MLICYSKIVFKYAYMYSILNRILFTLNTCASVPVHIFVSYQFTRTKNKLEINVFNV